MLLEKSVRASFVCFYLIWLFHFILISSLKLGEILSILFFPKTKTNQISGDNDTVVLVYMINFFDRNKQRGTVRN